MNNTLTKIDAKTTHQWIEQNKAVLIDVRETDEYIREHIPEAHLVPLSGFNPEDFPKHHDKIDILNHVVRISVVLGKFTAIIRDLRG